jgi:hypothetical protein
MFLPDALNLPTSVVVFVDVLIIAHLAALAYYLFSLNKSIFNVKTKEQ